MRTSLLVCLFLAPLFALPAQAQQARAIPVILDTDIGDDIDDAFALALALVSPELELRGVTTVFGDAHTRARMAGRFLHAVGRKDIPVASGQPARDVPGWDGQMQYGLRPLPTPLQKDLAVEFMYKQFKAHPGEITLVAVGPLTNVAELLTKHADCKPWIKRIVIMGGSVKIGYNGKKTPDVEWNIKCDIPSAQTVFAAGLPMVVAPLDATGILNVDSKARARIFRSRRPINQELQALYQIWSNADPVLFDPMAVALCVTERFCKMEELRLTVDDKGFTRLAEGKPNCRVAMSVQREAFLDWYLDLLGAPEKDWSPHKIPLTNPAKPVDLGPFRDGFPNLVHVIEDYETDIERRWWLAGKLELKNVPKGSKRACRGVWTNDFDERMGNPKAQYTGVIFNPVPGPPMGKITWLNFGCWLKGATSLRVQIYSLSRGYHRHLTLTDLPQEKWQELIVDLTKARRPDGSGGPLEEGERIDDIQFYTDAGAELIIDDIVLYDRHAPKEPIVLPFPARPIFTAWFDTGKQGKEWPGVFEIVDKVKPDTGKAARSVPKEGSDLNWIKLSMRGKRPVSFFTSMRLRYQTTGKGEATVKLLHHTGKAAGIAQTLEATDGKWSEVFMDFVGEKQPGFEPGPFYDTLVFEMPRGVTLLIDDVMLYGNRK
jgi:inosine-uridine nucleoside N-ribohydrolase